MCPLSKHVGCSFCRLMEHEDDPGIDEPYVPPAESVLGEKDETKPAPEEPTLADTAEGQGVVLLLEAAKVMIKGRGHPNHFNQAVFELCTCVKSQLP